ncbi:MAG: NGG1p interacting factor NIF3 [Candidatus Omnitrophica bacterium]|nr:NGG1p interacting factor NIF3 [Candidatus Omnitrophota bacterium]MDD5027637.1 NGG1p interacting factor NIF3 [Candidatus Omnitrophota bacterium]MDD5661874.1 NGG1p interacting factor NIF3 [Candidatus Omnitrophota bacterium]
MKLSRFYNLVVKFGAERDPRKNKSAIKSYADTAILYGDPGTQVKKILVGIDMEVGELLLADRIRQAQGLDLALSHHPEGRAYALLHEVMQLQVDLLREAGLDENIAQKFLDVRKNEVERKILPQNHTRPIDAARLLKVPFMCMHTPADNHVYHFLKKLMETRKARTLQDIVDILGEVPEYREAGKNMAGPRILVGSPKREAGKIFFEMTGGTEGPKDIFGKLYRVGVRTLVSMHLSEEHLKKVKDANLNVVIAGHISSDCLGLNLLLDRIEKEEKLEIIGCSGFKRIKRG